MTLGFSLKKKRVRRKFPYLRRYKNAKERVLFYGAGGLSIGSFATGRRRAAISPAVRGALLAGD